MTILTDAQEALAYFFPYSGRKHYNALKAALDLLAKYQEESGEHTPASTPVREGLMGPKKDPELERLLVKAREWWETATPEQQEKMLQQQRASWARQMMD